MLTRRQTFFATTAVVALGATGTAYAADKVIKIGVDLSLTGANSQGANRVRNGIIMAFDAANAGQRRARPQVRTVGDSTMAQRPPASTIQRRLQPMRARWWPTERLWLRSARR